jgi:transmembrane sensor
MMDRFKKIVKDKVQFDPVLSTRDQDIWGKLDAQIAEYEAARDPWKKYYLYIAAACIALCMSLAFVFLNTKQPSHVAVNHQEPQQYVESPVLDTDPIEKNATEKPLAAREKESEPSLEASTFVAQPQVSTYKAERTEYQELADGTVIALKRGSSLLYNPTYLNNREVQLQGHGYFEVAHDPGHPFKVYFDNTHLIVLGTKFYVQKEENNRYKVSVVEGKVKVYNPAQRNYTVLVKDQELLFNDQKTVEFHASITAPLGAWRKSCLAFNDTPLPKVFFALSKESGRKIEYNPDLSHCLFTGDLSAMSLTEALNFIKITANLVIEEKDEHLYISGNSCD